MTSQLSPTQANSTEPARSSLKPESLHAARSKIIQYWVQKTIPVAIAVGVLPIFGLGVLNFGVGQQLLGNARSTQIAPEVKDNAQSWLTILLLGAGATAVLTGSLAWLWLKVFVNALVKQSTQLVTEADQFQISESLQDLGYTIGLLQEQDTLSGVLETAAVEVRSLLNTDRVMVFCFGMSGSPAQAEDHAPGQRALLQADRSHLSLPLDDLFKVPMGYVQVCSEVQGSDLPQPHQTLLAELGVQAQMVTQITLDNQSQGVLVAQSSEPRDWTEVEHQLFAAIAKQIAIALDRKAVSSQAPTHTSPIGMSPIGMDRLWSNYHNHCLALAQSSNTQAEHLKHVIEKLQIGLDNSHRLGQGLQQAQDHIHSHTQILQTSEAAVNRSMTSITQMQETLAQSTHSGQQLIDLGQRISQASTQVKDLADRVNYQAMNASITAKKQIEADYAWSLNFTNEILQLTRELSRQTSEIDALSTQILAESNTLAKSADIGSEQLLVSTEWFRDSRQQWNHMVAVNGQLESSLRRLTEHHQNQQHNAVETQQQILELSHWLNQTVEESDAMVQSIEQLTSQAFA